MTPDAPETLPAPPVLPSDLQQRASDPAEREAINNDLVKSALAAMAQEQSDFLKKFSGIVDTIAGEVKAQGSLLSSRLDALEESVLSKLTTYGREAQTMAHAIDEHTGQIKEVLRLAGDTFNMATTSARDIERVRRHIGIPDELDAQQTPEAHSNSSAESDGS